MKKLKPFTLLILLHAIVLGIAIGLLWRQPGEQPGERDTIVIIPIEGMISMGRGAMGRGDSVDDLVDAIDHLSKRPHVKAIVLKINSPGGSVGAVQAIHGALLRYRKSGGHVVSTFGDVAASGGYYVACAGERIVSYPGTLTGSIGVVLQIPNVTGLMQKVGVKMENVVSGSMKDAGSPFRAMTDAERAHFKLIVTDAYSQFFEAVRTGRNLTSEALKPVADGRVMSGRMAQQAKLVDKLGGVPEAVELAKELAGIADKEPRIIEHQAKASLERFFDIFSKSPTDRLMDFTEVGARLMYVLD